MSPGGVWTASLIGAFLNAAILRLGVAWRDSRTSRLFRPRGPRGSHRSYVAGSAFLSTAASGFGPSRWLPYSLGGRIVGLVWRALVVGIGGGPLGRFVRRTEAGADGSLLAGGAWVRPLGAALCSFALARLLGPVVGLERVTSLSGPLVGQTATTIGMVALALAGLAALVLGGVAPAGHAGVMARAFRVALPPPATSPRHHPAGSAVVILACVAATSLGAFAGLTPGVESILPLVAAVVVVAAASVLYRVELLLLVLAAFPWVNWAARASLGALGGAWDDALLLGGFSAAFFSLIFIRRIRLHVSPTLAPLALAVVVAVGSVLTRDVPTSVAVFGLRVTFEPILFFFLAQLLPRERRWVRAVVFVFLGASLLLAFHGLFQYVTGAPIPESWVDRQETDITARAYSVVENPNGLGAFLLLGSILSVSLALSYGRSLARLAFAGTALVLMAGLAVTFSRGAWLGFIVGLIALAALSQRRLLAPIFAALLVAPLLAPPVLLNRLIFAFSPEYLGKSAVAGRLFAWRTALDRIIEHPWLGMGLGTLGGSSAAFFGYHRLWIDNFYLQLAAEGGLILLGAFLWLLLRVGKGLVASHQCHERPILGCRRGGGVRRLRCRRFRELHRKRLGDTRGRGRLLVPGGAGHGHRFRPGVHSERHCCRGRHGCRGARGGVACHDVG